MKVFSITLAAVLSLSSTPGHAEESAPTATPEASATLGDKATLVTPPTPVTEPPPAGPVTLPQGPSVKSKTNQYSIRRIVESCTAQSADNCLINTFVVATNIGEEEPLWERRIYFQRYDLTKPVEPQAITVKSVKLSGRKILKVTNGRGDNYELELKNGHLTKPKDPREYRK